jgi:thiamine biosynthesis lipoprotein
MPASATFTEPASGILMGPLAKLGRAARRTLGADRVQAGAPAAQAQSPADERGAWYSRDEAIMGTAIHVELWSEDRAAAEAGMAAVMEQMHHVDRVMSPHKPDSELSRVNRDAARAPVPVGRELFGLLQRSLDFSRLSGGAFDITFASAGHLYDYRERIHPSPAVLAQAVGAIGYEGLQLDADACTVRFARAGMRIDLGGFAKGHAVDQGARILRERGVRNAIVTAGGDSHIVGDRRGRPWTIGVRDPRRPDALAALLPLADVAVSTSGDYERYFEEDGVRFHHVLDPRTGACARGIHSVTILAQDGLTSEALSKSVFVLGVEQGMRLVESFPGVDAVVVDAQGVLHYSRGLRQGGPQQGVAK